MGVNNLPTVVVQPHRDWESKTTTVRW